MSKGGGLSQEIEEMKKKSGGIGSLRFTRPAAECWASSGAARTRLLETASSATAQNLTETRITTTRRLTYPTILEDHRFCYTRDKNPARIIAASECILFTNEDLTRDRNLCYEIPDAALHHSAIQDLTRIPVPMQKKKYFPGLTASHHITCYLFLIISHEG